MAPFGRTVAVFEYWSNATSVPRTAPSESDLINRGASTLIASYLPKHQLSEASVATPSKETVITSSIGIDADKIAQRVDTVDQSLDYAHARIIDLA